MTNNEYKATLDNYISEIDSACDRYLPLSDVPHKKVIEAMRYSLLSSGKRVRAVLMLLFAHMLNKLTINDLLPFAVAIEMIHASSLIHDDLPCMDNADLRRGIASCHKKFSQAVALLAGDGLLSTCYEVVIEQYNRAAIKEKSLIKALRELSACYGVNGIVGGQTLDIDNENGKLNPNDLIALYSMKTTALLKSGIKIAGIISEAGSDEMELLDTYADCVGMAFQIVDDILDVDGDEENIGKPTMQDEDKYTYVKHKGVETAKADASKYTQTAIECLEKLEKMGYDIDFIKQYTSDLLSRDR